MSNLSQSQSSRLGIHRLLHVNLKAPIIVRERDKSWIDGDFRLVSIHLHEIQSHHSRMIHTLKGTPRGNQPNTRLSWSGAGIRVEDDMVGGAVCMMDETEGREKGYDDIGTKRSVWVVCGDNRYEKRDEVSCGGG